MKEKKPALLLGDELVELKIKPKECVLCGGKYIPTGPGAKFCPKCRQMTKKKRDASLFAKHAELAFGPGPWATYKPEPEGVPDILQMAIDTARAIAHETKTKGLRVYQATISYTIARGFFGQVVLDAAAFYKVFDERPFEYEHARGTIKAFGDIDGVEVCTWLN